MGEIFEDLRIAIGAVVLILGVATLVVGTAVVTYALVSEPQAAAMPHAGCSCVQEISNE